LRDKRPTICGRMGLSVTAEVFSKAPGARVEFLGWSNSGQRTGDYENCVSYVAMAVYASDEAMDEARQSLGSQMDRQAAAPQDAPELTPADRQVLLRLARSALERSVRTGSVDAAQSDTSALPDSLRRPGGAFVTLKVNGALRGCIGHIVADRPLAECVERMAGAAALMDYRFRDVGPDELAGIKLEISALGPMEPLASPSDVKVGRDGLLIRAAGRSGLLLPQVPVEEGWDREEFLRQTCLKARLPSDAWQAEGVQILRFTATVFGEE
jgi:AmmeMemoRadiSam system protein A